MSDPLKLLTLTSEPQSETDWSGVLGPLSKEIVIEIENKNGFQSENYLETQKFIDDYDIVLVDYQLRLQLARVIRRSSIRSHFLKYFDYLERIEKNWWGHSVYSEVFYQVLLHAIKNQDYKGAVIFLGFNSMSLPILDILNSFGFKDFVFLEQDNDEPFFDKVKKQTTGLVGAQISLVDSATFIQSQKEYSFCFVMKDKYHKQTLDDMSYFHFLSSQSMVFDIIQSSNFLFKEVNALGVEVVSFESIKKISDKIFTEKIKNYQKNKK